MGWDASLGCPHCDTSVREWNYTHNTSRMVYAALEGTPYDKPDQSWWKQLDGMSAKQGAELLATAIEVMRDDPSKYRAMNPENGWGDFTSFFRVLCEMHDASDTGRDLVWSANG